MLRAVSLIVFASIALAASGQSTILEKVWTTSASSQGLSSVDSRVNQLVADIAKHHYKNDVRKLHALFMKTQNRFLHSYVQYTGIEELANGRYDCLTATSLYADILTKAGYEYNIVETNSHIFIIVKTSEGKVILETTDRFRGFITDEQKMIKALVAYQSYDVPISHHIYQSVKADQLPGLLYFNQAVKAFNARQWQECSDKLSVASGKSNSPRIAELAIMLYRSVQQSNALDTETRSDIMRRWKGVVLAGMPLASR